MKYCIICGSNNVKEIYNNFPGYVENKFYEIFSCKDCDSHFINPQKIDNKLYDIIYSKKNVLGYNRYYNYAKIIKDERNPLKYLSSQESTYYPIYKYLRNKSKLKVLEIGCGYGYLTFALKKAGFDVVGIDLSHDAIDFAIANYGNYFYCCPIEDYINSTNEKYDLIVATELIEHLPYTKVFFEQAKKILKKEGGILLTTPNKDYFKKNAVWNTDLPPIHVSWLGKKSFLEIAKQNGFKIEFVSFADYYPKHENRLFKYLWLSIQRKPEHFITENGEWLIKDKSNHIKLTGIMLKWIMVQFSPIRFLSNLLINLFFKEDNVLGVLLERTQNND